MKYVAYSIPEIEKLQVLQDSETLHKSKIISDEQYDQIENKYASSFYSPAFTIKILLFIVSTIAISGITGFVALIFSEMLDNAYQVLAILYGIGLFIFVNIKIINGKKHFRSGVTEALLYHAASFFWVGIYSSVDFNEHIIFISLLATTLAFALIYLDYISSTAFTLLIGAYVFYILQQIGGITEGLAPFILLGMYSGIYFLILKLEEKDDKRLYEVQLSISKYISLLIMYLCVNYFVVREMSIELMNMHIPEGEDIPFAFLFYAFTILIPAVYLYLGIKKKSKSLIRVSLIVIGFSVFTFKYYYSLGHPEITITLAGAILLGVSFYLLNYLKTPQNGFTREQLLTEKWAEQNIEATIISQTLGGNEMPESDFKGNDGEFGGGGASGSF